MRIKLKYIDSLWRNSYRYSDKSIDREDYSIDLIYKDFKTHKLKHSNEKYIYLICG